jgi:hypothetical protein
MSRLGKKTLYLDLEALAKIEAALAKLPGRPSLSSYFNDMLPSIADVLTEMVASAEKGGLRGIADMIAVAGRHVTKKADELDVVLDEEKPASEPVKVVPPKKVRKTAPKKVVQT